MMHREWRVQVLASMWASTNPNLTYFTSHHDVYLEFGGHNVIHFRTHQLYNIIPDRKKKLDQADESNTLIVFFLFFTV